MTGNKIGLTLSHLQPAVSNGNPKEQALIRRWWHTKNNAKGKLVWEYYLEGKFADAVWFFESLEHGVEKPGANTSKLHPLENENVIMCEAKMELTPEVIGQALVYTQFAKNAGANVIRTIVFCQNSSESMIKAATALGLETVIESL